MFFNFCEKIVLVKSKIIFVFLITIFFYVYFFKTCFLRIVWNIKKNISWNFELNCFRNEREHRFLVNFQKCEENWPWKFLILYGCSGILLQNLLYLKVGKINCIQALLPIENAQWHFEEFQTENVVVLFLLPMHKTGSNHAI